MPPKRDDGLPGEKLLTLYQRLTLDARRHYQTDLVRDLNRSPQTISHMVEMIDAHLGKDAYIEKGLDGRRRYYQLRTKSEDKVFGFSAEELRYIALCRDLAKPYLPEGVGARIDRTLAILALQLGEEPARSHTGAPIGFHSKGYIDYTPHLPTISTLRQAIAKRQVCDVSYTANGRECASAYRYGPGRIVAMNGTLYVQGYRLAMGSLLKERPTTFSLHRISGVMPTGEFFSFDAGDAEASAFGLSWHPPKHVRIHVAPQAADYVRDRIWSGDQVIEEHDDGSLTLSLTTTSEKELSAWVWSFGGLAKTLNVG